MDRKYIVVYNAERAGPRWLLCVTKPQTENYGLTWITVAEFYSESEAVTVASVLNA